MVVAPWTRAGRIVLNLNFRKRLVVAILLSVLSHVRLVAFFRSMLDALVRAKLYSRIRNCKVYRICYQANRAVRVAVYR